MQYAIYDFGRALSYILYNVSLPMVKSLSVMDRPVKYSICTHLSVSTLINKHIINAELHKLTKEKHQSLPPRTFIDNPQNGQTSEQGEH